MNNDNKDKELQDKLKKVLNTKECEGEECIINEPQELVQQEDNEKQQTTTIRRP